MKKSQYSLCAAGLLLALSQGCGKPPTTPIDTAKTDTPTNAQVIMPGEITGKGWHIPWRTVDPKHPNGPRLTILIADAIDGKLTRQKDDVIVRLGTVRAQLFQDNKRSAIVLARVITWGEHSRIVIGTGGVKVTSLTNPPDTVITADKMTWDIRTTKVIAIGNAHVVQYRNGSLLYDTYAPRAVYDTKTGDVEFEQASSGQ